MTIDQCRLCVDQFRLGEPRIDRAGELRQPCQARASTRFRLMCEDLALPQIRDPSRTRASIYRC